ncbi:hypothetical protein MalM25_20860 [Planctomycetes bacterium MalM25]|nr:hypothetical protein MalM25_20860 [Planctomycetes bacterium MalM25]
MRPSLPLMPFALLALAAGPSVDASAQCCGTPTVAYSPVVAAPAPVVATTTVSDGWYPGKALANFSRNLFGWNRVNTTYTAGYGATPYTAGYAPYTAGYAPYSVGYAATPRYTAGYAPTYQVAYRPTYPASYGPVAYTQTVSRPVVLSPVVAAPACDTCSTGCGSCNACGGVEQATYLASPSSSCSSCAAGGSVTSSYDSYDSGSSYVEPRPTLAPNDNVPAERSIEVQRPDTDDSLDDDYNYDSFDDEKTPTDPAAANDYWRAPPLFAPPSNRVTQRAHPAPAKMAVYRRPANAQATAFRRPAPPRKADAPRVNRLSADGWASAE